MAKRLSYTDELVGDVIRGRLVAEAMSTRKVNGKVF